MSKPVYVFYAGLLYGEFTRKEMRTTISPVNTPEVYNGGYVYLPTDPIGWYRCDLTPLLIEDVPKELRTAVLLLT